MKTQFRRTAIALACALPLFAACQRDPAPASAPSDPAATSPSPSGPQTALGRTVESALNKAQEKLRNETIVLGEGSHFNINGASIGGGNNAPRAEITPQGDFLVDGKTIAINHAQRQQLLQYRYALLDVIAAGMAIGAKGADMAGLAIKQAIGGLFGGNPDQTDPRMEAEGKKIEAEAQRICDALQPLLQAQRQLAAALAEFEPYATLTQQDVDRCREKSGKGAGIAVASVDQQAVREDIRDGIRKSVQAAARGAGAAAGSVATAVGATGSNVTTINGIRFLLPPGGVEVDSRNTTAIIRHANGLRVRLDDDALSINGESYPRPAANGEVDLRTSGSVKVDGKTVTATP